MIGSYVKRFGNALGRNAVMRPLSPMPLDLFNAEQAGKLSNFGRQTTATNMLMGYFKGMDLEVAGDAMRFGDYADPRKARIWQAAGLGLAGLAGANMMGLNPYGATDQLNNVAMLGMNAVIGSSLYGMVGTAGRVAGVGYLGLTAFNTFRRGDQIGPM